MKRLFFLIVSCLFFFACSNEKDSVLEPKVDDLSVVEELNTLSEFNDSISLLSGEILPQRKLPRTITLRNISSEIGLIKYIFDVASFEEDLTNRV